MKGTLIHKILDLAEIWALLIPLTVYFLRLQKEKWIKPVLTYLLIALALNFCVDVLDDPLLRHLEPFKKSNHFFYNLHSLSRLLCFTWFFAYTFPVFRKYNLVFLPAFLLTALLYFIFWGDIFSFAGTILTLEAAVIMLYCISWFYFKVTEDTTKAIFHDKSSWIVFGICFYAAICFFIFLFYKMIIASGELKKYSISIWDLHNIAFTIMCISFARALYKK